MVVVHPPADSFGKIADHVVQHISRQDVRFLLFKFPLKHLCQAFFEITHEHFAAFAGENTRDISAVFLKMIEYVRDLSLYIFSVFRKIVCLLLEELLRKHVVKYLGAKGLQQFVLRFKSTVLALLTLKLPKSARTVLSRS